ncbi:MAG: GTPase HflX, partial [Firmicutes bacterium]|nr:GTPase HflX [Bacillota bacterium]
MLVGVRLPGDAAADGLEELAGLADSAGAEVVGRVCQERHRPDPAFFVGRGKALALAEMARGLGADLVIFDHELSAAQARNLEDVMGVRVVDRTQVILDIFARRARTREGKLQVELAQLNYLLPRLTGAGTALSRLGGGIGTRGPGETKLETDRRRVRRRIYELRRQLEEVRRHRAVLRQARRERAYPLVALVGYTNAGKSTLFRALTGAEVPVEDKLFATLDPFVRRAELPEGGTVLLTDTVGFIRRLPHHLIAAFRATLEEVRAADLLLHVADARSPDLEEKIAAVGRVLEELGAADRPAILVYNKIDGTDLAPGRLRRGSSPAVAVSALHGWGLA